MNNPILMGKLGAILNCMSWRSIEYVAPERGIWYYIRKSNLAKLWEEMRM